MVTYRLRNERTGFERTGFKEKWLRTGKNRRKLFSFVLLLFGEFKCCLLPYGSHYTSPLLSTASEFANTEYRKIDLNRSWKVKAGSHVFIICLGRAEIKHVLVGEVTVKL